MVDLTIEKVFADELVVNQARITAIVRKMPNIGTVPNSSPLAEQFAELKSSVGMKVREYDHTAGDVVSSISLFFKNSYGIISELEGPNVNYFLLATSILDLARGALPNKSLMCKSMLSRAYLPPLILMSFESRRRYRDRLQVYYYLQVISLGQSTCLRLFMKSGLP